MPVLRLVLFSSSLRFLVFLQRRLQRAADLLPHRQRESNRTKAAALIEIGQNLKIGFDRIVGNGTDFADVVIDPTLKQMMMMNLFANRRWHHISVTDHGR